MDDPVASVPTVPIVPVLLDIDGLLEADWDEIDAFGLMAEIGPFDRLAEED